MYRALDIDLTEYNRVVVSPVEIWYDPNSAYKGIRPEELEITAAARERMVQRLAVKLDVVDRAGPGTLVLHLALTNVYAKRPKRGALASAPIGPAQMEARLLDANTGATVAEILVTQLEGAAAETTWEQVLEARDGYAQRLASNF